MCYPTYPVFRSGSILAGGKVDARDAVKFGESLRRHSNPFVLHLISEMGQHRDWTEFKDNLKGLNPTRVRIHPAITVDFPTVSFVWAKQPVEFRVSMTTPAGTKQGKIWIRYNLTELQRNSKLIKEFYQFIADRDVDVRKLCLQFYNGVAKDIDVPNIFTSVYDVNIRVISANNSLLDDALETKFSVPAKPVKTEETMSLVSEELVKGMGLALREPPNGIRRGLVGFRYPVNRMETRAFNQSAGYDKNEIALLNRDDVNAICLVDIGASRLEINGVAHEPSPPDKFYRSAPHIVSGEISFEVSALY